MITFLDGPAASVVMPLRRAPVMLRVVRTPRGKWDALDQPDDVAQPNESIFVYRLTSKPSHMHICGRRAVSGWYATSSYKLHQPPPFDHEVRDNTAWAEWCERIRSSVLRSLVFEKVITHEEAEAIAGRGGGGGE